MVDAKRVAIRFSAAKMDKKAIIAKVEKLADELEIVMSETDLGTEYSIDMKFLSNISGLQRAMDKFVKHWK